LLYLKLVLSILLCIDKVEWNRVMGIYLIKELIEWIWTKLGVVCFELERMRRGGGSWNTIIYCDLVKRIRVDTICTWQIDWVGVRRKRNYQRNSPPNRFVSVCCVLLSFHTCPLLSPTKLAPPTVTNFQWPTNVTKECATHLHNLCHC